MVESAMFSLGQGMSRGLTDGRQQLEKPDSE